MKFIGNYLISLFSLTVACNLLFTRIRNKLLPLPRTWHTTESCCRPSLLSKPLWTTLEVCTRLRKSQELTQQTSPQLQLVGGMIAWWKMFSRLDLLFYFTAPALVNAYATHLHPSAQSLGLSSVAGTPQLIAAAPTQAGLHVAASQGIGSYHHASAVAAYAAVSPNALTQPHNIATTPAPGAYAHLATHLQQQTAERFWSFAYPCFAS